MDSRKKELYTSLKTNSKFDAEHVNMDSRTIINNNNHAIHSFYNTVQMSNTEI